MKYTIHKLDRRYSHSSLFDYYIGFTSSMINGQGPLNFTRAQKWFLETYGWSADVNHYAKIQYWQKIQKSLLSQDIKEIIECNPCWSWTINSDDSRIYVASGKELAFFQLKYPLDQ